MFTRVRVRGFDPCFFVCQHSKMSYSTPSSTVLDSRRRKQTKEPNETKHKTKRATQPKRNPTPNKESKTKQPKPQTNKTKVAWSLQGSSDEPRVPELPEVPKASGEAMGGCGFLLKAQQTLVLLVIAFVILGLNKEPFKGFYFFSRVLKQILEQKEKEGKKMRQPSEKGG